jgi:hypothetical protein
MAGCWEGRYENGRIVTEQWMKPLGGTMLGMSRTVRNGMTTEFEYVRLEQAADGSIRYVALPSRQAEASFTLLSIAERTAVFENPAHDFPQRIIYRFVSPDSILARIENITGGGAGHDYPYRRVPCR